MNGVEEGSIRCYGICQNCQKKIHVIGIEKPLNKYRREIAIVIETASNPQQCWGE